MAHGGARHGIAIAKNGVLATDKQGARINIAVRYFLFTHGQQGAHRRLQHMVDNLMFMQARLGFH